jgi:hypothetical protein
MTGGTNDDIEARLRAELPQLADAVADGRLTRHRSQRRDAFDDPIDGPQRPRHRAAVLSGAAALVLAVALIAVPLALRSDDGGTPGSRKRPSAVVNLVAAAAGTTVATGSYQVDFTRTSSAGAVPPECRVELQSATSTVPPRSRPLTQSDSGASVTTAPAANVCAAAKPTTTTGVATINVDPYAMRVVTDVSNLGKITLLVGPGVVWEFGGAQYGRVGGENPGASLAKFASLVEGTLGRRDGALAMTGLANPNGYVDLTQASILDAAPIGTSKVDGVPVTVYRVHTTTQAAVDEGLTPDAAKAIHDAVKVLEEEGYRGSTQDVSIDADGLIRRTKSVVTFADGGTATNVNTFSKFGCAGIVVLPGQPEPPTKEQRCWTPPTTTTPPTTSAAIAPTTTPTTTTAVVPVTPSVPLTSAPPTTTPPTTTPPTTTPPSTGPGTTTSGP